MRRLFVLSITSVLLYWMVFGLLVDRPLSLGILRLEMIEKTARLAALPSPKLVILAGSNGPFSHSCAVIGDMLGLPCENAGIAVGIGLDEIFARYRPYLHKGDIIYMPMELQQYTATRAQYAAYVDGAFLFRHDRIILASLPPLRILGAAFCCTLPDFLESLAEMPIAAARVVNPAATLRKEYNAQGDRIDNILADADPALLNHRPRRVPSAAAISRGYGAYLIGRFVAREAAKGVIIIGGLPTDYNIAPEPAASFAAAAAVYTENGARFMVLPNKSRYPVRDFFNSEDHLVRACQFLHSMAVARNLAAMLGRVVHPPTAAQLKLAAACPSAGVVH